MLFAKISVLGFAEEFAQCVLLLGYSILLPDLWKIFPDLNGAFEYGPE